LVTDPDVSPSDFLADFVLLALSRSDWATATMAGHGWLRRARQLKVIVDGRPIIMLCVTAFQFVWLV